MRERWRLERESVLDSRPAKRHGVSLNQLRVEWSDRTFALGYKPQRLVQRALYRTRRLDDLDGRVMMVLADSALKALGEGQSSWRRAELVRELASAVPTTTAVGSLDLIDTLDELAEAVTKDRCVDISGPIPAHVPLRRDGRPITEPAVDHTLTTRAILDEEEELLARAQHRIDHRPQRRSKVHLVNHLSRGQQDAVAAVAGDGGLELIVGPAGAGKTTMLASARTNLGLYDRPVFGVAPTAAAAPARKAPSTPEGLHRPPR